MSKVADIVKPFTAEDCAELAHDSDCLKRPLWFWEAYAKFLNELDSSKVECAAEAAPEVKEKARKKLWSKVAPIPVRELIPYIDSEKVFDIWKKLKFLALKEAVRKDDDTQDANT